jgi:hypothetical protein
MINLEKFISEIKVIVPVRNKRFQYNRKIYSIESSEGWKEVTIQGNTVLDAQDIFIENYEMRNTIQGYTYGDKIIFQNFDVAKRKINQDFMDSLYFYNVPTFYPIEAIIWEDRNLYFYRQNYKDTLTFEISNNLDESGMGSLEGIKGVTPELKTVFLFHSIEKQNQKKLLQEAERKGKEEEFKKSIPGRLYLSFAQVGAKLLNYTIERNKITVDWQLQGSRKFNSVIDANTFKIIEAGYCLSGGDKKLNITSMVLTAEEYEEKRLIHITRTIDDDDYDEDDD